MQIRDLSRENPYEAVCTQLTAAGFEKQVTYWEHQTGVGEKNISPYFTRLGAPTGLRQIWANSENGLIAEISSYPGEVTIHGAIVLNERGQNEIYNQSNAFQTVCQELYDRKIYGRQATKEDIDASASSTFAGSFVGQFDNFEGSPVGFKHLDNLAVYEQSGLNSQQELKARSTYTKADHKPALTFSVDVGAFASTPVLGQEYKHNGIDLERFTKFLAQYGDLTKRNLLEDPHVEAFLGRTPAGLALTVSGAPEVAAWKRYQELPDSLKADLGDLPDLLANKKDYQRAEYEHYQKGDRLSLALQGMSR